MDSCFSVQGCVRVLGGGPGWKKGAGKGSSRGELQSGRAVYCPGETEILLS